MTEKGDISIEGFLASSEYVGGIGLSAAGAFTDNDGLGVSFMHYSGGQSSSYFNSDTYTYGNGIYFDAFYSRFGVWPDSKFTWSVSPGLGFASSSFDEDNEDLLKSSFVKIFIQPSIGFKHKNFETALSSRISYVDYTRNPLDADPTPVVFEPALLLRAGWRKFKFQSQFVYTTMTFENDSLAEKFILTLGLQVFINAANEIE